MGTLTTSAASADPNVSPGVDIDLRVVVIDDRHDRRQLVSYVVQQAGAGVKVVGYVDGSVGAVEAVRQLDANVVVLEIQIPVTEGLDAISTLRDNFPALSIIVCSFHNEAATKQAAFERGADAYLVKPLGLRELRVLLDVTRRRPLKSMP